MTIIFFDSNHKLSSQQNQESKCTVTDTATIQLKEVVTPVDSIYPMAIQLWNRAAPKYPWLITYCCYVEDVCKAIRYAHSYNLPIRIRSGGHNFEGFCSDDQVLVIDISRINFASVSLKRHTLTVGGGISTAALYNYICKLGYPFPGGTCPTVGVSGFVTGGGWGLSCRKFGLGCDQLTEIELVNHKGCVITANKKKNKNLFWAIRGAGGGNFGVITSMTFTLPKETIKEVTYFEFTCKQPTLAEQTTLFNVFQTWITTVSNEINIQISINNSKDTGIIIFGRGISYLSKQDTEVALAPLKVINSLVFQYQTANFLSIINHIGTIYPLSEYFKSTGRFVTNEYSISELQQILALINQPLPEGSLSIGLTLYGLGGKVADIAPQATAFYYRNSRYIILLQTIFESNDYKEANVTWFQDNINTLYSMTIGSYVNFPVIPLPNYLKNYYGNNYPKLLDIKKQYDPNNLFSFPQSIR